MTAPTANLKLVDIPTPALILDQGVLEKNLVRMAKRADELGVELRPHLKTAKCAEVAKRAVSKSHPKATVSTLHEAEYFFSQGIADITYSVGITVSKLAEVKRLLDAGLQLNLVTDSYDMAERLCIFGEQTGICLSVLLEIDCGARRAGFMPDDPELIRSAKLLHCSEYTRFLGLMTHAGHSYSASSATEIVEIAEQERAVTVAVAQTLETHGVFCKIRSVGSTPTAVYAENLNGITEMRPGVYVFNDVFQAGLGTCRQADMAVSVLATVISDKSSFGYLLVDAGALALSQDMSAARFTESSGYGLVYDESGIQHLSSFVLSKVHQEHGWLQCREPGAAIDGYSVGSRVRIFPNHVCMTAAPYEKYYVVDGDDAVIAVWHKTRGW